MVTPRCAAGVLAGALLAVAAGVGAGEGGTDLRELFEQVEEVPLAPTVPTTAPRAAALLEVLALVTVTVDGVRDANGSVRVLAFADAEAWAALDPARAVGYGASPARAGSVTVTLRADGRGPYALFAFHDDDDDETFTQRGGRPREGHACSGGAEPRLPPPFARAATVRTEARLRLDYPATARRR